MSAKLLRIAFLVSLIAFLFLAFINPLNSRIFRLLTLLMLFNTWLLPLFMLKKHRVAQLLWGIIPLLIGSVFFLPQKKIDRTELQKNYIANLKSLNGTTYIWGGEGRRGIDCSGLPRLALRDALLSDGFHHLNGTAFRQWFTQWWYDTSAKALSENYKNFTQPLHITGTIKTLDYHQLQPGDLAVTTGGIHVLAYIGGEDWIQADPHAHGKLIGQVIIENGKTSDNTWHTVPITMHRWSLLAGE